MINTFKKIYFQNKYAEIDTAKSNFRNYVNINIILIISDWHVQKFVDFKRREMHLILNTSSNSHIFLHIIS